VTAFRPLPVLVARVWDSSARCDMAVHLLSPYIPTLNVPRAYPCGALTSPEVECGATPASLYLRACGTVGHEEQIWLCIIHATMAACGGAICKACARRGGVSPVILSRLSEPLRFTLWQYTMYHSLSLA
jgi:hypothetical protein